jgi:hypothetical protein
MPGRASDRVPSRRGEVLYVPRIGPPRRVEIHRWHGRAGCEGLDHEEIRPRIRPGGPSRTRSALISGVPAVIRPESDRRDASESRGMSTEAEVEAERIAVKHGRGQATKQVCKHCDGKNRGRHFGRNAQAGVETCAPPCCQCGGYGYIYLTGVSGGPRSVPQLLGKKHRS